MTDDFLGVDKNGKNILFFTNESVKRINVEFRCAALIQSGRHISLFSGYRKRSGHQGDHKWQGSPDVWI